MHPMLMFHGNLLLREKRIPKNCSVGLNLMFNGQTVPRCFPAKLFLSNPWQTKALTGFSTD